MSQLFKKERLDDTVKSEFLYKQSLWPNSFVNKISKIGRTVRPLIFLALATGASVALAKDKQNEAGQYYENQGMCIVPKDLYDQATSVGNQLTKNEEYAQRLKLFDILHIHTFLTLPHICFNPPCPDPYPEPEQKQINNPVYTWLNREPKPELTDMAHVIELKMLLTDRVYNGFEEDISLFVAAIEMTDEKPHLQKLVILQAPWMLMNLPTKVVLRLTDHFKKEDFASTVLSAKAKQDPEAIFKNVRAFNHQPYTINILKIAVDAAIEKTPNIFFDYLNHTKWMNAEPWYEDKLELAARKTAEHYPLEIIHKFYGISLWIEDKLYYPELRQKAIDQLMETQPYVILVNLKDDPLLEEYIEPIFRKASKDKPLLIFEHREKLEGRECYPELLENAAKTFAENGSEEFFLFSPYYKDAKYYPEALELAATKMAENGSEDFFKYTHFFIEEFYFCKLLEIVSGAMASKGSSDFLKNIQWLERQPTFPERVKIVTHQLTERGSGEFFEYYPYINKTDYYPPLTEKVARKLAEKGSGDFFKYQHLFKGESFYPEALEMVARKMAMGTGIYDDFFENIEFFQDQPYFSEVLELALRTATKEYGHKLKEYKHFFKLYPWTSGILTELIKRDLIYYHASDLEDFMGELWIKKTYLEIAENNRPDFEDIEQFYVTRKHYPFFQEIWETIATNHPWQFMEFVKNNNIKDPETIALIERCEAIIEIAQEGVDTPNKIINKEDFPIDQRLFEHYLTAINHKAVTYSKTDSKNYPGGYKLISIPMTEFKKVFFAPSFQELLMGQAGKMTYMNAFSLAQTTCRYLEQMESEISDESVREASQMLLSMWNKIKNRELFGPNTRLILFTHQEKHFDNESILDELYFSHGGKSENVLANIKGLLPKENRNSLKEEVLGAIGKSQGPTTVLFIGHGGWSNLFFSGGTLDNLDLSLGKKPNKISHEELGDALHESGNIENINLIVSSCFSYDYIQNLFEYLETKGTLLKPFVSISQANKHRLGFGESVVMEFDDETEEGQPIDFQPFLTKEAIRWFHQDPALFTGSREQYESMPEENHEKVIPSNLTEQSLLEKLRSENRTKLKALRSENKKAKHFLEIF